CCTFTCSTVRNVGEGRCLISVSRLPQGGELRHIATIWTCTGAVLLASLQVPPQPHAQASTASSRADSARMVMLVPFDKLQWTPREPAPGRSQISIVHVDPITKATQLYFRLPPRMHAARHWHSANETNVVVRGTFVIQHEGGEKMTMSVGDFNSMPKRMIHQ